MFGKKYFGIERSTFLIDKKGMVRKVWKKVERIAGLPWPWSAWLAAVAVALANLLKKRH